MIDADLRFKSVGKSFSNVGDDDVLAEIGIDEYNRGNEEKEQ